MAIGTDDGTAAVPADARGAASSLSIQPRGDLDVPENTILTKPTRW